MKHLKKFFNFAFLSTIFLLFSCTANSSNSKYYVVNFNTGEGSYVPAQKVEEGNTASKPNNPTRDTYTFAGWYLNNEEYDFNTKITKDITITAKWSKNDKYYKFDFRGSNCSLNNDYQYKENSSVNLLFNVTSGFELPDKINVVGVDKYNYSKANKTLSLVVTNDITVICDALPQGVIYTVKFYINGIVQPSLEQKVSYNHTIQRPINPTKIGYIFDGWYTNSDYSSIRYGFDVPLTSSPPNLYGKFNPISCHVVFNANEGKIDSGSDFVDVDYNTTISSTKTPTVSRVGYTFNHWWDSPSGGTKFIFDNTIVTKQNLTLYAHWTLVPIKTINIYFNPNGGKIDGKTDTKLVLTNYGEMPVMPVPIREASKQYSYVFNGWDKTVVPAVTEVIYNAQWINKDQYYDITFSAVDAGGYFNNNPDCKTLTYSYKYGDTITNAPIPYKPSSKTKSYSFNGWSLNKVTDTAIYKASFTEFDKTFTIQWLNYDLTVLKTDTVAYGVTPVYSGATPIRNADFEGAYTFVKFSPTILPAAMDAVYIAQFEISSQNSFYPQTLVTDANIINELDKISAKDKKGYKEYNGSKYFQCEAVTSYISDSGVSVKKGDTNYYKVEPIEWRTLKFDITNKKRLVTTEKLLDVTIYQNYYEGKQSQTDYEGNTESVYANNYKFSKLRTYLNVDFLNRAFTDSSVLTTSEVNNSLETTRLPQLGNPYVCENTFDKIFALSYQDILNTSYFPNTESKKGIKTDFARANYAGFISDTEYVKYGLYWTRSPDRESDHCANNVNDNGDVPYPAYGVGSKILTIRPAILSNL